MKCIFTNVFRYEKYVNGKHHIQVTSSRTYYIFRVWSISFYAFLMLWRDHKGIHVQIVVEARHHRHLDGPNSKTNAQTFDRKKVSVKSTTMLTFIVIYMQWKGIDNSDAKRIWVKIYRGMSACTHPSTPSSNKPSKYFLLHLTNMQDMGIMFI